MWDQGGQPWPQWPLSSQQQWMQSFQHQQDPGQVDWAALAQAWIAQKESTGGVANQQGVQPNGQEMQHMEPPAHNNHGAFPGDPNFGRSWQPEWGMHGQPPPPPPPPPEQVWNPPGQGPMDVVNPSEDSNSQDSLEFPGDPHHRGFPQNSHGFGGQPEPYPSGPVCVNQFDYQHGAAPTGAVYGPPSTGFHAPYWPEGPQNRRDRLPGFRPERPRSPNQMGIKPETPTLDAVKRRTLPAWIREGLEKMDREKQKKLEKERMEKERAEMANNERTSDMVEEEGDGPRLPRKSKFDSDDEDGEEDGAGEDSVSGRRLEFGGRSSPVQEDQSEPEMTEEEKEFQLMLMTKTLLTEVLLEVTNEEIFQVAKETHRKATKAPAKQLAQSNALASLTGLGGLGDYGSDESEDEERSAKGSDSSDTDDEELLHRIRQKQDAFRRKEREQQQLQERLALEVQTVKDLASGRERAGYEEEQTESKHKQEVREREAEPTLERRRSRSEPEVSEVKRGSKEHTGRNGGSASPSPPSERRSRTSSSSSSSSRSSSSSSSSASSRSSSRSSSPRRKRRCSSSASRGTCRRSRSRSSRRRQSERDKGRDRRRSSRARSTDRSSRHSHSQQRRSSRGRRSRSKASRSRSRERRRSRDRSRSLSMSRSRRKQKASSKDRDRRKERSRSHEKDKKKKDLDKKKVKQKGKEKEGEGSSVRDVEDDAKSRRKKESERTDSHSERFSRQDSKFSKKGSAKASKKYSDSESSRSRSPSPEVSKEKKSKKSKRSRSRSTERSHKSGKKASRKHKSKSRSRSASPSRRKR
ncbi:arginine/serine-rich protein PNISR-like isoform X2 [Sinocyclocheilus anshuiensis]|uniref:arginine/serine-rich protein PNISR-like isoform X2 n=1 Tax=Sinocyclocheilus anshuiensis TaxID=1608454 RepID=UPI0007B9BD26|nr:PREDICTED: arginine/serine-rich protein PNISR-like isoform X2 [Sinocyclocheilus anshuiensis]